MPNIAMLFDFEEGHYFTSFKMAKALRAQGHTVRYLGPAAAGPMVREQGFDLVPVLEPLLGSVARSSQVDEASFGAEWFGQIMRGEALDDVMRRVEPDLVVMLSLYYPEALAVQFRYRVPIVLWTGFCRPEGRTRADLVESWISARMMSLKASDLEATLRAVTAAGHRFGSFKDLAALVLKMPELIAMPRSIELPNMPGDPNLVYIGTGIDLVRREEPFAWSEVPSGRYLVYCSMGSQSEQEPESARRFFRAVHGVASAHPEWQLLLAMGRGSDPGELGTPPANLLVRQWLPQLEVLRRADLFVTHGGAGSVKEAVLLGVPMVVLPLMRDQFEMAKRVVHHRLGVSASLAEITPEKLGSLIGEAAADGPLKGRLDAMRRRCEEEDRSSVGVEVIERTLAAVPVVPLGRA